MSEEIYYHAGTAWNVTELAEIVRDKGEEGLAGHDAPPVVQAKVWKHLFVGEEEIDAGLKRRIDQDAEEIEDLGRRLRDALGRARAFAAAYDLHRYASGLRAEGVEGASEHRLRVSAAAALERVQVGDTEEAEAILAAVVKLDGERVDRNPNLPLPLPAETVEYVNSVFSPDGPTPDPRGGWRKDDTHGHVYPQEHNEDELLAGQKLTDEYLRAFEQAEDEPLGQGEETPVPDLNQQAADRRRNKREAAAADLRDTAAAKLHAEAHIRTPEPTEPWHAELTPAQREFWRRAHRVCPDTDEPEGLTGVGDHMQSEGSRMADWIRELVSTEAQSVPYEVHMAALEMETAVKHWTDLRCGQDQVEMVPADACERRILEVRSWVEEEKERVEKYHRLYIESQAALEDTRDVLGSVRHMLSLSNEDNDVLREQIAGAHEETAETNTEIERLRADVAGLEEAIDHERAVTKEYAQDTVEAKRLAGMRLDALRDTQSRVRNLKRLLEEEKEERAKVDGKLRSAQECLANQGETIRELQSDVERSEKNLLDSIHQVKLKDGIIEDRGKQLEHAWEDRDRTIGNLQTALDKKQASLHKALDAEANANAENVRLEDRLNEKQAQINGMAEQIILQDEASEALEDRLKECKVLCAARGDYIASFVDKENVDGLLADGRLVERVKARLGLEDVDGELRVGSAAELTMDHIVTLCKCAEPDARLSIPLRGLVERILGEQPSWVREETPSRLERVEDRHQGLSDPMG